MRWHAVWIVLGVACTTLPPTRAVDRDTTGGDDGPCPDGDGDGVCDADDLCDGGDDGLDADADGTPDGCDACPDSTDEDFDDDGLCGDDDLCPRSADDDCDVGLTMLVSVDLFPDEASFEVVAPGNEIVAEGGFSDPGEGYQVRFEVPANRTTCVNVDDGGDDGGVRGLVFQRRTGLEIASWGPRSYGARRQICFKPTDGRPADLPDTDAWIDAGTCEVEFAVWTGRYPSEISWVLYAENRTGMGEQLAAAVPDPNAVPETQVVRTLTLATGAYVVQMGDLGVYGTGDGWDGASWSVRLPGEAAFAEGTLSTGGAGSLPFTLRCPGEDL